MINKAVTVQWNVQDGHLTNASKNADPLCYEIEKKVKKSLF